MSRREERELYAAVAASPLFAACSPGQVRELVRGARETSVPAGWTFVHESTPADACYLIVQGTAEVVCDGDAVATLGAGDIVGEVALARTQLRNANVTARTPMHLLHVDAAAFARFSPRLRDALLRDVQQRSVVQPADAH